MTPTSVLTHLPCIACGYDLVGLAADSLCPECAEPIQRTLDKASNTSSIKPGLHSSCLICGYDLTGIPADAPCPECGKTVKAAHRFVINTALGPAATRRVQRGCRLVAYSCLAIAFLPIVGGLTFVIFSELNISSTASLITLLVVAALWLLVDTLGWWLAVTPPANLPDFWPRLFSWASRASCIAMLACLAATFLINATTAITSTLAVVIPILAGVAWWLRAFTASLVHSRLLGLVYPLRHNYAFYQTIALAASIVIPTLLAAGGPLIGLAIPAVAVLLCTSFVFGLAAMANLADLLIFEWAAQTPQEDPA